MPGAGHVTRVTGHTMPEAGHVSHFTGHTEPGAGHVTARDTRHWSHYARIWSYCLHGLTSLVTRGPGQKRGGQRDGDQQVPGSGHPVTSAVCHPQAVSSLAPGMV